MKQGMAPPVALRVVGVKKRYKIGQIGGSTLQADLQSWWAKKRGKEDPNAKIGQEQRLVGQKFMALNGVDFTVYQGEAVGIIGGNGAGKSTLLKIISQVTAPTEGTIELFGRVASMLEVGTGFNGEMTGRENVYMNGAILGMSKAEIDAKMDQIIEFSEVKEFIDTPVKRYSSGMYVKLAFSVAAHLDSEIMIMDEVLAVGDVKFQQKCLTKMRQAAKHEGRTVLYVSHNMSTIRQLCDRCIVLDKGKVIFEGDVETAIRVYSGATLEELPIYYDLRNAPRPSNIHGTKLRISEFEFLEKKKAVYLRSEIVQFRISFEAYEDIDNLRVYFVLHASNGSTVGTAQTEIPFGNVNKGKSYTYLCDFDIRNLAAGDYNFRPDIFNRDDGGNSFSYDQAMREIYFQVVDDLNEGFNWKTQYLGFVHLSSLNFRLKEVNEI